MNVSRVTSGIGAGEFKLHAGELKIIFQFSVSVWSGEICLNVKMITLQLKLKFNSNAPLTKSDPQIAPKTSHNLYNSDACSMQFCHISCLMLSQCCQLNLHTNGTYTHLQCRHNCPFHMDWLTVCFFLTHAIRKSTLAHWSCDCRTESSNRHV